MFHVFVDGLNTGNGYNLSNIMPVFCVEPLWHEYANKGQYFADKNEYLAEKLLFAKSTKALFDFANSGKSGEFKFMYNNVNIKILYIRENDIYGNHQNAAR